MLGFIGREVGDHWEEWRDYLHYVDYVVLAAIVAGIIYLLIKRRGSGPAAEPSPRPRADGLVTALQSLELTRRRAAALGAIQGPTELLPVSSSAHLILVPWLLGWRYAASSTPRLRKCFEVALHAGDRAGAADRPAARDRARVRRRSTRAGRRDLRSRSLRPRSPG